MNPAHPLPPPTPMQLLDINNRLRLEHRKLTKTIDSVLGVGLQAHGRCALP